MWAPVCGANLTARPWLPCNLNGLQLWLAADTLTGLADGAAVTTWRDLSGRGYDAVQTDVAKKPTFQTGEINGRPIVRADAVDDVMNIPTGHSMLRAVTGATIIAVVKWASLRDTANILAIRTGTGVTRFSTGLSGTSGAVRVLTRRLDANALNTVNSVATPVSAGTAYVHTAMVDHSAATCSVWVNGVVAIDAAATGQGTGLTSDTDSQLIDLGCLGGPSDCDYAELIVVNRALSTAERQLIERYLGRKYGLAVA